MTPAERTARRLRLYQREARLMGQAAACERTNPPRAYRLYELAQAAACVAEGDRLGFRIACRNARFWRAAPPRMVPANDARETVHVG